MTINPMQSAHDAPRCKASSKRTGKSCRAPAVRGCRVCRMHGAGGGAPAGKKNGNYRHGKRTKEVIEAVRYINLLSRLASRS
jgi:glucans biosynthesis protein